jgi:arylsulfatase A-like enzyme
VLSSNLRAARPKNTLYEGGVRVSALPTGPAGSRRKLTAPLHAADWMPTLTKPPVATARRSEFDGLDVWPL